MIQPRTSFFISAKDITISTNQIDDYAVKITHMPTGIVSEYKRYKSHHKNKIEAIWVLKRMLYETELKKHSNKISVNY